MGAILEHLTERGERRSLYDRDLCAWAAEQARFLRDASFSQLDVEHVAEEIEDLAASRKRELKSRTRTLVEHLLKLECSPAAGPIQGWLDTIRRTRVEIQDLIDESPSLAGTRGSVLVEVLGSAGELAARSLIDQGEDAGGIFAKVRAGGLTAEEVFGTWFPERLPRSNRM